MRTTRGLHLFLLLALDYSISVPASALEPCSASNNYVEAVDRIIDGAVGRPAEIALTVLPSFEAEYGSRMIGRDLYFVQLSPSLWASSVVADGPGSYRHDFQKPRVSTSMHKASLSPELALRVREKYASALSALKVSETAGFDGVTYRFAMGTIRCGETWSPEDASPDGQLVELTELLAEFVQPARLLSTERSEKKILRALSKEK